MSRYKQSRACKFCGKAGLVWAKFPNKYGNTTTWLQESDGRRHECDEYRASKGKINPATGQPWKTTPTPAPTPAEPTPEPKVEPTPTPKKVEPKRAIYPEIPQSHYAASEVAFFLKLGLNVMVTGDAGTGKSYGAKQIADFLGIPFYPMSIGKQTSKSDVLGYMGAHGYVTTVVRTAFEHGGLLLLDEGDTGEGVMTIFNGIAANDKVAFPDNKVVTKHKDFRLMMGTNTLGHGADEEYSDRVKLDAAFVDRFVGVMWDYDRDLETALYEGTIKRVSMQIAEPTHVTRPDLDWKELVWLLRDKKKALGIKDVVYGSRKIYNGRDLLNAGVPRARVEEVTIWFGVSPDDKAKLLRAIGA